MIIGIVGRTIAMKPVPPTTYPGPADAAKIMGSMARACGLAFENNAVSVQLASPYFAGTLMRQMAACAKAANIYAHIDGASNTLAIWPKTGNRGGAVPVISPSTGMIGYPQYSTRNKLRALIPDAGRSLGDDVSGNQMQRRRDVNCAAWALAEVAGMPPDEMLDKSANIRIAAGSGLTPTGW